MIKKVWHTPEMQVYTLMADMLQQKHLLIAGATGSGKSVLTNGLIYTALKDSPAAVQFILIDPKGVELQDYESLPHVIRYACNGADMITALQTGLDITVNRFTEMKRKRIKEYDGSHVYIIIDELADLMTTNKKSVVPIIQRIGQIGRAARVHIIACTQCPLAEIIPTTIKVNFDSIVGLRTATSQHSRNIIGVKGCEDFPDPKEAGRALGYYRKGANLQLYNIPMQPQEDIEMVVHYWTHTRPRLQFGR